MSGFSILFWYGMKHYNKTWDVWGYSAITAFVSLIYILAYYKRF